ncbi:hypothetical protein KCU65_g2960, partial [Aureobasidium melanogenum]
MSDTSSMDIDQPSPSSSGQTSPFNPLTFNPLSIPSSKRSLWRQDPPLEVADGNEPKTSTATSAREYYRILKTTYVSPAVKALGTNPYPGLRQRRWIQELETETPEYNGKMPWMGISRILQFVTPGELQRLGCINLETDDNPEIEVSPRFKVDTATLASASKDKTITTIIGNNKDIHPCLRRQNWKQTSDAEYEYLKPVLRIVTKMLEMDGVVDLCHACDIRLDTHLLYIISGGTQLNASYYNPSASDKSAYMRTQLLLANVIIHELTHAWFNNVTTETYGFSPFRNDDRAGEEGFALETVINKNSILVEIHTNISIDTTPFGIAAQRWPGLEDREGIAIKASAAKYGIRYDTLYAVPMSYIQQFFLDDFWDNRILRFGDGAVNNYKAVGVRVSLDLNYDGSESPTVKQKQDLLSGLFEDDPEIDPDAEYPDVDEGIIYPNRILTLLGQEMSDSDIEMGDADESDDDSDDDGNDEVE